MPYWHYKSKKSCHIDRYYHINGNQKPETRNQKLKSSAMKILLHQSGYLFFVLTNIFTKSFIIERF